MLIGFQLWVQHFADFSPVTLVSMTETPVDSHQDSKLALIIEENTGIFDMLCSTTGLLSAELSSDFCPVVSGTGTKLGIAESNKGLFVVVPPR